MMSEPLLTVCLITYNHAKYIRQAIDGVLMQKVDFHWELIIADDCSTDGTKEILLVYKEKYPDQIKLILQSKNVGAAQNWVDLMISPKSKYTAYFEGDDYWTNPDKLQNQIDFLESNPDYSLCFHDMLVVWENGSVDPYSYCKQLKRSDFTINDIIKSYFIPTAGLVFRTKCLNPLPDWIGEIVNGDYALQLLCGMYGKVQYIDEQMAVYRRTLGTDSMTSRYNTMNNINGLINLFNLFNVHSNYRYSGSINRRILGLKFDRFILQQKTKFPIIWSVFKKLKQLVRGKV